MRFDWHNGPIARATPVEDSYRTTQAMRRFLAHAWPTSGSIVSSWRGSRTARPRTGGEVADEWLRRRQTGSEPTRSVCMQLHAAYVR
ncbi:DUF6434 domain-containing protein [Xanthomonas sp. F4]